MIHSTYHKKNTCEDPKTSAIFETLLMLPDDLFWDLLRGDCFENENLPPVAGPIEDYKFWPHWSPINTTNTDYVEPDVFIRFQYLDIIIEAKYSERVGQYCEQWRNEIISYHNEYGSNRGPLQERAFEILAKQFPDYDAESMKKMKENNRWVWHEDTDCKTMYLVPQEIHNNLHHFGGVGMLRILRRTGLV